MERLRYGDKPADGKLHFNHIQWSPDGTRFILFCRVNGNKKTISYTSDLEGKNIRFLGKDSSHFEWRDTEHILIWAKGAYRLYKDDGSGKNKVVLKTGNGHNSYLPGKEWILTDTYPNKRTREKTVYLYHIPTKKKVVLGRFFSPKKYRNYDGGKQDTHPRISRDGTKVVIDSSHGNNGRQLYMIDISEIIEAEKNTAK